MRPAAKPRTTPTKVATGPVPHQRSIPNPIIAGSEKLSAMVETLEAHSNIIVSADRDSGAFATDDSPLPRRRYRHPKHRPRIAHWAL